MIQLSTLLFALLGGLAMWWFSAYRLNRQLDAQSTELTDPLIRSHVARMADVLDLDDLHVYVFETPAINGLASPDGRIFITRGFLDKYRLGDVRSEEIAGVIAHELGHVALGHSKRRMFDFTGQNAVRVLLATVLGRFIPFIGIYIANFLSQMLAARLSRQDEYEADEYAAALMTKIGLGTGPQVSLFQKLERIAGGQGGQLAWLMSHPRTDDRIAAINRLSDAWRAAR
ncbi:MAG: M48 family metallopeptidase [Rubricella sp.]